MFLFMFSIVTLVAKQGAVTHNKRQNSHNRRGELAHAAIQHASQRQFDPALVLVKQAIEEDPDWPDGFNPLEQVLEVVGDRHEAIKNYRVALDLDPKHKPPSRTLTEQALPLKNNPTSNLSSKQPW